jgi:hypothetical protein
VAPQRRRRSGRLFTASLALGVSAAAALAAIAPGTAGAVGFRHHHRPGEGTAASTTTTTVMLPMALPQPAAPAAAPEDTCLPGSWAPAVLGRPASYQPGVDAVYLWHDPDGGWALRATHGGARQGTVYSGSLTTLTGEFIDVSADPGSGTDIVYLCADKHTIYFRFAHFGALDGLDFATHCARGLVVAVHMGGRLVPAGSVHLGANGSGPAQVPFRVSRARPPT